MRNPSRDAYAPAEDTYFLEDCISGCGGEHALDMGSGSGYLARSLSRTFTTVVGTEISYRVAASQVYKSDFMVCCSGADALACKFDLIACNPPYLASDAIEDAATDGGRGGVPVPLEMVRSAAPRLGLGGRMILITSSLSDYEELMKRIRGLGMRVCIAARKKLFFEELIALEIRHAAQTRPDAGGGAAAQNE